MSILDETEKAILRSGVYIIRHSYNIYIPSNMYQGSWQQKTLDNGVDIIRITDHGSIVREAFNQTMSRGGNLIPGTYRFVADNMDGLFNRGSDLWVNISTSYIAEPLECRIQRWCVLEKGSDNLFLGSTFYDGMISNIKYTRDGTTDKSVEITTRPREVEDLERIWDESDYDEIDLGTDIFGAPIPEEN